MTFPPRIKICCINSVQEARLAIRYGADALGLVSHMPSGPGVISEELIAEIAGIVPPGVASFLLTSLQDASSIISQHRRCLGAAAPIRCNWLTGWKRVVMRICVRFCREYPSCR